MHGKRKVFGLIFGAIGIGILISLIIPAEILVLIECLILIVVAWLLLTH
jgi:hypothetical protein